MPGRGPGQTHPGKHTIQDIVYAPEVLACEDTALVNLTCAPIPPEDLVRAVGTVAEVRNCSRSPSVTSFFALP